MAKEILITKADGTIEPFSHSKLIHSLRRSGADTETAEQITRTIESTLKPGTSTNDVYREAFELLRHGPKRTITSYSLRKAIMLLGPTGFPFEMLLREIFRAEGYKTSVDTTIKGRCIPHEVDVLAYNDEKVIVVEAKYHNERGIRTDIKDTLYVKARFDDLEAAPIKIEGQDRCVNEGWLVTNTKFTSMSIQYAECQRMTLIGWNYPQEHNLQQLIEEHHLHPITVLPSLSYNQIQGLLSLGAVLCRQLRDNKDIMVEVGMSPHEISEVLQDISEIY